MKARAIRPFAIALVAAAYVATAELGFALHSVHGLASLVWAPTAIGLACIILYGNWMALGMVIGHAVVLAFHWRPLIAGNVIGAINVLEALAGAYVLRECGFRCALDRLRDVAALIVTATVVTLASASLSTASMVLDDLIVPNHYLRMWSTWWWGHLSADLVVAPLLLTWLCKPSVGSFERRGHIFEAIAFAVAILAIGALVFFQSLPNWLPGAREHYLFPLLLWAGLRFTPRGAALANFAISSMAMLATSKRIGPFGSLADLQTFVAITATATLALSAMRIERIRAIQRKGAILRGALDAIITIDSEGRIVEFNPAAEALFGIHELAALGRDVSTMLVPPALRGTYRQSIEHRLEEEENPFIGRRFQVDLLRANGSEFRAEVTATRVPIEGQRLFTAFVRDITAEQRAEQTMRESHEMLEHNVRERTAQLEQSLDEKEVLLREIHHRVKNNLQVISSLLNLQVSTLRSADARKGLIESQSRIQSMALVHQLLYQSRDLANIDLGEYLDDLVHRLAATYRVPTSPIETSVTAPRMHLDIDRAIPCGLIVNELVTNSLIHAFPEGRPGRISVCVTKNEAGLVLEVRDDGIGLPDNIDFESASTFGLRIARILAEQLDGSIEIVRNAGTTIRLKCPI